MSLQEKLDQIKEAGKARIPEPVRAVMGQAVADLVAAGLAAGVALRRPLGPRLQWALAALAALAVADAWRLALAVAPG